MGLWSSIFGPSKEEEAARRAAGERRLVGTIAGLLDGSMRHQGIRVSIADGACITFGHHSAQFAWLSKPPEPGVPYVPLADLLGARELREIAGMLEQIPDESLRDDIFSTLATRNIDRMAFQVWERFSEDLAALTAAGAKFR